MNSNPLNEDTDGQDQHRRSVNSHVLKALNSSCSPTVLELLMALITATLEKRVEANSWLYLVETDLVLRINTDGNLPEGECVLYYPGGARALVGHFTQGERSGHWTYFRPDGARWHPEATRHLH